MQNVLIGLSAFFTVICIVPYLRDIIKGSTKPRLVSWLNWSLLTGIATAAAIADKQYPSAVLTGFATLETTFIVIISLHYGNRKFEKFDVICQIGALCGLLAWFVFNSPLIALVATVSIDFLAGLPTFRHAFLHPEEETMLAFVLAGIGALCALLALRDPHISGVLYPAYITFANALIAGIILYSPHAIKKSS